MNNNQNQVPSLMSSLQSIPLFYKLIALCLVVTGVFSLFTNMFPLVFANYPYYTIFYANIWRLVTSIFIADGMLTAIMSILVLWFVLPILERNISTVMLVIDLLVNNFAIQFVYSLIWIFIYFISQQTAVNMRSMGIWGVWMVILTRICQSDPQGDIKFCCMPFTIKKKFYPLAMITIIGVIAFYFPLDMLIGYLIGFIQCKFLNGTLIRLPIQQYKKIQDSAFFKCVNNRNDFKKLQDSQYSQSFCRQSQSTYVQFYGNFVNKASQQQQQNQNYNIADSVGSTNFDNMKGGIAIGETKTQQAPSPSSDGFKPMKAPEGYAVFQDQR